MKIGKKYIIGNKEGIFVGLNEFGEKCLAKTLITPCPVIEDIWVTALENNEVAGEYLLEGSIKSKQYDEFNCILEARQ